jgi:Tfp pilus assembly protein PilN
MLTVNLLPEASRHAGLSPIEQFHRTPLMWLLVGLMAAGALWRVGTLQVKRKQWETLQRDIQRLAPKRADIDAMRQLVQQLQVQQQAFKSLQYGKSLWSKRLNVLAEVTPEGVWFTELSLSAAKGLIIQGSAIGQGGSEMVSVGQLVQDLKSNPDVSAAVADIQIEAIKRVQEGEIEIVHFTLACALADGALPP